MAFLAELTAQASDRRASLDARYKVQMPDLTNEPLSSRLKPFVYAFSSPPTDGAAAAVAAPLSPLTIVQATDVGSTGGALWTAGLALSRYLEHVYAGGALRGKRVLELGCGTGLAGLVAASLGADAVLTDIASVLPLLRRNAAANASAIATGGCGGSATVEELTWGSTPVAPDYGASFDLVIAADVVYEPVHVPLLLGVLGSLLEGGAPAALVGFDRRGRHGLKAFLAAASEQLDVTEIAAEAMHPDVRNFAHFGLVRLALKAKA
jgi:predicted nicotinamide N-methyase